MNIFKKNFFDIFEMQHQLVISMSIFDNPNFQDRLSMIFKEQSA